MGDFREPGFRRVWMKPGMKIPAEASRLRPRRYHEKHFTMSQEGTKQTLSPLGQHLPLYHNRPRQEIKQSSF